MKNRTFVRLSSLFIAVVMFMSMFALCASAENKVVYDEENTAVEYDNGVVTVKLNATELGEIINERRFNKAAVEEFLPSDLYVLVKERSKAAFVSAIVNLADTKVFTYDELVAVFGGNETVMKKYVCLDLFAAFYKPAELSAALTKLCNEGKMDEFFAATREGLYAKLGVSTDAAVVADFNAFLDAVKDLEKEQEKDENKELQVLLPIRELTKKLGVKERIKKTPGSVLKTKTQGFIEQVLLGEIDKIYVDETVVYENLELDHNVLQTVLLQGLPSVDEVAALSAGDEVVNYKIRTEGPNIAMNFGFIVELFGDTSVINQKAETAKSFFDYVIEADGKISASLYFDERFVENYTKVLECPAITDERKAMYLSLYTADAATMQDQLSDENFAKVVLDAKAAGVKGSGKIDAHADLLDKARNYLLRAAKYATGYTNLDDAYEGNGVFRLNITEVIPLSAIEEKLHSRFSSIEDVMKWLKQDDHIVDTEVTFKIDNFYRVRFFDKSLNQLYVTYLPEGTALYDEDATILDVIPELKAYGPVWVDAYGYPVNEVEDYDLDLFTEAVFKDVEIVKIWDDNDDSDGLRPEEITIRIFGDGEEFGYVEISEDGYFGFVRNPNYVEDEQDQDEDPTVAGNVPADNFLVDAAAEVEEPVEGEDDPTVPGEVISEDEDDDDEDWDDDEDEDPNVWYATVTLPLYHNGREIEYTFVEDENDGYTSKVEIGEDGVITVTNTHDTEETHITIKKVWNDDDNRDCKRPESIVLNVFANGELLETLTVHGLPKEALDEAGIETTVDDVFADIMQDGSWYIDLTYPACEDGEPIVYTITEEPVEGYRTGIEEDVPEYDYVFTNTYIPETVVISGAKVWNDPKTKDQKRPDSIIVILLANGEEVDRIEVTGQGDKWEFAFEPVYKYEDGVEIVYTIDEVDVEGYNKQINGYEIVNSGLFGISMFVLASAAAAGGAFATVKVIKKRRDQE